MTRMRFLEPFATLLSLWTVGKVKYVAYFKYLEPLNDQLLVTTPIDTFFI